MNPADWPQFKANYMQNDYYPAELTWNGMVVNNIGIRHRGTGSRSATKPYLGLKMDQYVKGQQFLGLSSFRMKNSIQDPSFLHERLSMLLFRRMGMAAPREAYARLYVNNEYSGLYVLIEEVDNKFLDRVFGEHAGCQYNYNWIDEYGFEYLGDDPSLYSPARFEPKNAVSGYDPDALVEMIRAVNRAPDDAFVAQASQYLDLKLFLKHLAIENYLSEGDGIVGYAGMNNFYLYRFAGTKRFQFLPWDKDMTFDDAHHPITYNVDGNVLTRRIMQVPELAAAYRDAVRAVALEAGGEGGWLEQELDRAIAQIQQAVLEDPVKPADYTAFEYGAQNVRNFTHWRLEYLVSQLGSPPPPSITADAIRNGASFAAPPLAVGSVASIFGFNLGFTALAAAAVPLPTTLDQTTVALNGIAAPLYYVSPTQINFQIPWELAGVAEASVVVAVNGVPSAAQTLTLAPMAPALFFFGATSQGAILISVSGEVAATSGSMGTQLARPVRRGEFISIYCTGLGSVTNPPATGQKPSAEVRSLTPITPNVTIGGVEAPVYYSGLAPESVGVYQVDALVPDSAPAGSAVPVVLSVGGVQSNTVTMAVE